MKFTFEPESKPLAGYTIKRAIHRGGFGEVYYALSDGGKEVALKLLHDNMEVELRGLSHCLNLKHPNLVNIFDIRTDDEGDHWVVMEYVSGKTLDAEMQSHPNGMPMEQVRAWLAGIVEGASFLHDRGIVHRDLKPANIYSENNVVKVGDVGLSKYITPSRRSAHTQSVGTVYYMAPEVAHGRYGREVDVYSLGIILYEMLTGGVPFDGESTGEILMKHLTEKPNLAPIPERLRPVLAGALEKDPQKRTSSVERLYDAFSRAVVGKPVMEEQRRPSAGDASPPNGRFEFDRPNGYGHRRRHRCQARRQRREQRWARKLQRREARSRERARRPRQPMGPWQVLGIAALLFLLLQMQRMVFAPVRAFAGMLVIGTGAYLIHRGWRSYQEWNRQHEQESLAQPAPPASAAAPPSPPAYQVKAPQPAKKNLPPWRTISLTPYARRQISVSSRVSDLSLSLVFAVLCTSLITAALAWFTNWIPRDVGSVGLFGLSALLGAWGVLVPAKLCEGTSLSSSTRRVGLLASGILVGTAAYWLHLVLMTSPPTRIAMWASVGPYMLVERPETPVLLANGVFDYSRRLFEPTHAGYMLFFASLFALRRWWWHADAFRPHRFRVWSLLCTVGLGFLLCWLLSFPLIWGATWAAVISAVVQLSATWVPVKQRAALVEAQTHAI